MLDLCKRCGNIKHMKKLHGYYTLEKCKESSLKYKSKKDWLLNAKPFYNAAHRNNWLEECCKHMQTFSLPYGYWTLELCKQDALKYKTRTDWYNGSSAYYAACKNDWMDQCCQHMTNGRNLNNHWTLEECQKDALKYNSRVEWEKGKYSGYRFAIKNGWLEECCKHMTLLRKPNGCWTLETCKKDALLYTNKADWFNSGSGYQIAFKNGWLDQCCSHMKNENSSSREERDLFSVIKELYPDSTKKRFTDKYRKNKRFELDIYIPSLNVGIEFNGTYWHSFEGIKRGRKTWSDEDIRNYHKIKRDFFKSINIEYLEINESDWKKNRESCIKNAINFLKTHI